MVYCHKCGHKNPEDAKTCAQCGALLYPPPPEEYRAYRRYEEECFGIPRGSTVVTLFFGFIVVLMGLSILLAEIYQISIPWWPIVIIMFGLLIIMGALFRLSRKYH